MGGCFFYTAADGSRHEFISREPSADDERASSTSILGRAILVKASIFKSTCLQDPYSRRQRCSTGSRLLRMARLGRRVGCGRGEAAEIRIEAIAAPAKASIEVRHPLAGTFGCSSFCQGLLQPLFETSDFFQNLESGLALLEKSPRFDLVIPSSLPKTRGSQKPLLGFSN